MTTRTDTEGLLRDALALADSMIRSGERHSPESLAMFRAAFDAPRDATPPDTDPLPINDQNGPWCGCGQPLGHVVRNVDCDPVTDPSDRPTGAELAAMRAANFGAFVRASGIKTLSDTDPSGLGDVEAAWEAEAWRDPGTLDAVRTGRPLAPMQRARIEEWYRAAIQESRAGGGLDGGTTTDCPIEGVHEHAFRGPHRFHEWDPGS